MITHEQAMWYITIGGAVVIGVLILVMGLTSRAAIPWVIQRNASLFSHSLRARRTDLLQREGGEAVWSEERTRFIRQYLLPKLGLFQRLMLHASPGLRREIARIVEDAATPPTREH